MLAIVLLGTAASNAKIGVENPVWAGVVLVLLATLPAVFPLALDRLAVWWLVGSGGLCGLYFALGYADGPVFLALPTVTFLMAAAVPVRQWFAGAFVGVLLLGSGLWARWQWHADEPHKSLWQAIGMAGIVLAAGAVATATRNRFEATAAQVQRVASDERLRMAQDLHDGVGHGLAVIAMQAGVALHLMDRDPEAARQSLEAIRGTSKEALDSLRAELAAIAGETAPAPAPRRPAPGVAAIPALLSRVRSAGLGVEVHGTPGELSDRAGAAAYAVLQESLTNVLRHAAATTVVLTWSRRNDAVVLRVADDGRGGEVHDEGMGISGMRSRIEALGGSLRAGAGESGGLVVEAEWPA